MSDPLRQQLQATLDGTYRLEHELGGGGMSRVFLATEVALGREVVVKVLTPALAAGVSADRFAREVKLSARLQHPNIVPLLTAGETQGLPWYTMPFVRGESLRARLSEPRGIEVGEATSVLRDIARALAYAHGEGVVHRDIKPENVLLSGGAAMVADFGIAKAVSDARTVELHASHATTLTQEGMSLGTPAYMAPEQATGQRDVDHRADLYAWGVMAWEALAGQHPFAGRPSVSAMIAAHIAEAPPPLSARRPEVPPALAAVVMRCLEKDPAQRPGSAGELLAALDGSVTPTSGRAVPVRPRGVGRVLGIAALALLAAATAWTLSRRPITAPSGAPKSTSLAVLPFASVGGDTANAYFAEGISDELTTALTRVPDLRLAGRRSAARFSGSSSTVQEIGQALKVGAVLEGSVRRAGDRVRVSAELTSATDGVVLWSDTYERAVKDVFAVQDDIAHAIVGALSLRLAGNIATSTAAQRGTNDLEAYDLYLRGLHLFRRRGPGVADARVMFERAIARDTTFARAYAALAPSLIALSYFMPIHIGEVLPAARAAAERALRLDDALADAHVAMGAVHVEAFAWEDAEREYRRAIALDPTNAESRYRLANLLIATGRGTAAVEELEIAKDRDPLYSIAAAYLSWAYWMTGRGAEAIAEGQRALELEPNGIAPVAMLASVYHEAGRHTDAIAMTHRAVNLTNAPARLGTAARILAEEGERAEAEALVRRIETLPAGTWGRETGLAFGYLGLGNRERALAAMERAAAGDGDLLHGYLARATSSLLPLRDDPRLQRVLRRYNLSVEQILPVPARR